MPALCSQGHRIWNRAMTGGITTLCSFFILIQVGAQNPPPLDSGTAHIQSVVESSKRVRKILNEAKSGTKYRISFVASSGEATDIFQGYTTRDEGDDKNGITVHISPGLSDELTELLAAHELFHIVLQKQGWPTQVNYSFSRQEMDTTFRGTILKDAGTALLNCYPDALIDKWMSALGFEPKMVNRRQHDLTIQDALATQPPPPGLLPLFRTYTALNNYCLSIRERDFEMEDIFKAFRRADPAVADDQATLERELGTSIECSDVPSCLEATKALRQAAGFQGEIYFLNRFTNTLQ